MKKFTLFLALAIISVAAHAAIWRVNSNTSIDADFNSLQNAINSSSVNSGDTLYCENGSYFGDVVIDKSLVIIGPGYFLSQNDSTHAYPSPAIINNLTFRPGSDNSTITGMKIISTLQIGNAYDTISNISFIRNRIKTIEDYSSSTHTLSFENIVIRQCYIDNEISIRSGTKSIYIQNNIIVGTVDIRPVSGEFSNNTVIGTKSGNVLWAENTQIYNNILINKYTSYEALNSTTFTASYNNTISRNVMDNATESSWPDNYYNAVDTNVISYQGSGDSQYQLESGSPAIGYGFNGNDCGAFGGSYPYVLSGLPYMIPHIFEAIIPGSANKTDGLNVIIKAKVQNQ